MNSRREETMAVVAKPPAAVIPERQRRRERALKLKVAARAYLWLLPILLSMAVIVYYPLLYGLVLSFTNANQGNIALHLGTVTLPATYQFVGLQNYVNI